MFLYFVQLLEELDSVTDLTRSVASGFGQSQTPRREELSNLRQRLANLRDTLPTGLKHYEELNRCVWILGKLCSQPTSDPQHGHVWSVEVALVQLRSDLLQWARQPENYDKELVGAIANLLLRREYDSAIRKAFLILTERMRAQFGAPATVDGEDLVNHAFGKQASPSLPEPTRVALRNLFAGVYVLFRNRFSHQHVAPTFAETDAAIGVVNWALHELDKLP